MVLNGGCLRRRATRSTGLKKRVGHNKKKRTVSTLLVHGSPSESKEASSSEGGSGLNIDAGEGPKSSSSCSSQLGVPL